MAPGFMSRKQSSSSSCRAAGGDSQECPVVGTPEDMRHECVLTLSRISASVWPCAIRQKGQSSLPEASRVSIGVFRAVIVIDSDLCDCVTSLNHASGRVISQGGKADYRAHRSTAAFTGAA